MSEKQIGCAETPRNVVIIVPGYGVELTIGLINNYLRYVIETYLQFKKDGTATTIILTGGATALKSSPNETEAGVMKLHLERHGVPEEDIYLEEYALTTLENIGFSLMLLGWFLDRGQIKSPNKIIIFCAREKKRGVRSALHTYLNRKAMGDNIEVRACPLSVGSALERLFGGLLMRLWIIFPKTHEWHRRKKVEKIKNL